MAFWLKASGLTVALAFLALTGCKQGEGEICQVNNDCQAGLTCNSITGLCQSDNPVTPDPDAGVTPDAGELAVDAAPAIDAAPTVDATPDAAP